MFAEVLEVKRYMVREARKRAAQLVRNTSKLEQHGGGKGAGGPDMPRCSVDSKHQLAQHCTASSLVLCALKLLHAADCP